MKKLSIAVAAALALCVAIAPPARADVELAGLFTDNMVLQRNSEAPIWGYADPGEEVTVEVSWRDEVAETTAHDDGTWMVRVPTPGPGGPQTVTVRGDNSVTLENVMIGEVWLCSGQSNMVMQVRRANNADEEIKAADYPAIRMFTVERNAAERPAEDVKGTWLRALPENVGGFSAAGYFFGRKLHQELNVPIGLITSAWGGTPVEA